MENKGNVALFSFSDIQLNSFQSIKCNAENEHEII